MQVYIDIDRYIYIIVNKYKYLGLIITKQGTYNMCRDNLVSKATKVWACIKRSLYSNKMSKVSNMVVLFRKIIQPIILYGSEVWALDLLDKKNDLIEFMIRSKNDCDKFQSRCLKSILGVGRKATNVAVLSEFGQYPIILCALRQIVKFYTRLQTMDKTRALYKVYNEGLRA